MNTPRTVDGQEVKSDNFAVSSRRLIAQSQDMFVKEFVLQVGEEIPWHSHTEVFDIFYCLQGTLRVDRQEIFSGESHPTLQLAVGESARVEVGTAHRPHNPGPGTCRFLLVQGVGDYDWIAYRPA